MVEITPLDDIPDHIIAQVKEIPSGILHNYEIPAL